MKNMTLVEWLILITIVAIVVVIGVATWQGKAGIKINESGIVKEVNTIYSPIGYSASVQKINIDGADYIVVISNTGAVAIHPAIQVHPERETKEER